MSSELRVKSNSMPSVRKRSDIDIMANILVEAGKGTKKTRILYKCNLSHKQLHIYLQILRNMELLESHPDKENSNLEYFRTTSKGLEFIDAYNNLRNLML
jgi:predicted transcriptional regulator